MNFRGHLLAFLIEIVILAVQIFYFSLAEVLLLFGSAYDKICTKGALKAELSGDVTASNVDEKLMLVKTCMLLKNFPKDKYENVC